MNIKVIKLVLVFFFKQKTAYEMCGRDWSSDVCSSDLDQMPHDLMGLDQIGHDLMGLDRVGDG